MSDAPMVSRIRRLATVPACAATAVGLTLAATTSGGHAWTAGQSWLAGGGAERILSWVGLLTGAAVLLPALARRVDTGTRRPEPRFDVPWLAETRGAGYHGWTAWPSDRAAFLAGWDGEDGVEWCKRFLVRSLGPLASGPDTWPEHARQVAAVVLEHRRDRVAALGLAQDVEAGRDLPERHPNLTARVRTVLERHDGELRKLVGRHAFLSTALVALLSDTRGKHGVVSTSTFGWLVDVDPPLWFALRSAGRPTCTLDGCAASAHHRAERMAGQALPIPSFDDLAARLASDFLKADAPRETVSG